MATSRKLQERNQTGRVVQRKKEKKKSDRIVCAQNYHEQYPAN
jgi:hypothetical protein